MRRALSRRFGALLVALLFVGQPGAHAQSVRNQPGRNVLVVSSYHATYPWSADLIRGLSSVLSAQPYEVELWTEFLDAKRVSGPEGARVLNALLREKYADKRPDLLITADDDATEFLLRHQGGLFPGTPVVFCGVSGQELMDQLPRSQFTGLIELYRPDRLLRFATRMFPATRNVTVIVDNSATGLAYREALALSAPSYPSLHLRYLSGAELSFDQILAELRQVPPESIVIASMFTHGHDGRYLPALATSTAIASASSAPVFSPNTSELGQGYLAGNANSGFEHGAMAGRIAVRVLNGESPASIPFESHEAVHVLVDYAAMQRWGLTRAALPQGATVVNVPASNATLYKWIVAAAAFILVQFGIIAALILSILRTRRTESALAASESKIERAKKLVRIGNWEWNPETHELALSREVREMHGVDPGTLHAGEESFLEFVHPDDRARLSEILSAPKVSPKQRLVEYRVVRPNGQILYLRTYSEWQSNGGKSDRLCGMVQDITDFREIEEQFQHAQRVDSLGKLAGGIAHDFNNLLTVINGYSGMLQARLPDGTPEKHQVTEIRRAGERAAALTAKLLTFGRRHPTEPVLIHLNDVVNGVEGLLRTLLGESIELSMTLAKDLNPILADRSQLENALLNLVANARDAMSPGGRLTLTCRNEIAGPGQSSAIPPGEYVLLSVEDNGHGMDDATRARVFEPFFTTKAAGKGTGLGLSSVHGIVTQSGGHITVESEVGEGTTFRLYFPAVKPAPVTVVQGQGLSTEKRAHASGPVLLVDDDAQIRSLMASALTSTGYDVRTAPGYKQALESAAATSTPIHLLITDIQLADGDGVALARELETLVSGLPVLFITGYPDDRVAAGGERWHSLAKPFGADRLLAKVAELLPAVQHQRGASRPVQP